MYLGHQLNLITISFAFFSLSRRASLVLPSLSDKRLPVSLSHAGIN